MFALYSEFPNVTELPQSSAYFNKQQCPTFKFISLLYSGRIKLVDQKGLGSDMDLLEANYRERQVPNVVKQIRSEMWGCICPHHERAAARCRGGGTSRSWADVCYSSFLSSPFLFVSLPQLYHNLCLFAFSASGDLLYGIHHLPVPVPYHVWTDLSMTQLPLPLPTVLLNCTLIKLTLLITRA